MFAAVDHLVDGPRPRCFGSAGVLRIHIGDRYREVEITDRQVRGSVIRLGRVR